jgi:hypothetical protein
MDRRRLFVWVTVLTGLLAGLAAAALVVIRRRRGGIAPSGVVEADRERAGSPADRGRQPTYGIDVERLRGSGTFEPAVEYLTYIQSQRGVQESLLFIRRDDLEALAALDGGDAEQFLERLQQLGVVVSNN